MDWILPKPINNNLTISQIMMDYTHSARRESTGSLYSADNTPQPNCRQHPNDKIFTVCTHPSCLKPLCRRCQDSHEPSHSLQTLSLTEFIRKASRDLQSSISSIKDNKQQAKQRALQQKQNVIAVVDRYFAQLEVEIEKELERSVCQLETRYLDIKKAIGHAIQEYLGRRGEVKGVNVQVDGSMICLETVLAKMVKITKNKTASIPIKPSSNYTPNPIPSSIYTPSTIPPQSIHLPPLPPTIIVTSPQQPKYQHITSNTNTNTRPQSTAPSTTTNATAPTGNFFAFPSNPSSYIPPPKFQSKYEEPRKNVSLERDIGMTRKSRIGVPESTKDSLLISSKIFYQKEKDPSRPSLPTQPFAQILKATEQSQRVPLKDDTPTPNLERATSVRGKFTSNQIEQMLRMTSPRKKDFSRQATTKSFFESIKGKQNDIYLPSTDKFFTKQPDAKTTNVTYNFDDFRPLSFPDLPITNKTQYRASTMTDSPFEVSKPSTAPTDSYREVYQYKFKREEFNTADQRKFRV